MQSTKNEIDYGTNKEAILDHLYEAYKLAKEINLKPTTLHFFSMLAKALKDEKPAQPMLSSNQL